MDSTRKEADRRRAEQEKVKYQVTQDGSGVKITNSYTVSNPTTMHDYIEANRGEEIKGSTTGAVFEWQVHNTAYDLGKVFDNMGVTSLGDVLIKKGADVDLGNTIYDDNHGVATKGMIVVYVLLYPMSAGYDFGVRLSEKEAEVETE